MTGASVLPRFQAAVIFCSLLVTCSGQVNDTTVSASRETSTLASSPITSSSSSIPSSPSPSSTSTLVDSTIVDVDDDGGSRRSSVVTCQDSAVVLACRRPQAMLLVEEASFFETGQLCHHPPPPPPPHPRHPDVHRVQHSLLDSVNRRCAGKSTCNYHLRRDRPNTWRPGIMYIAYSCVPGDDVTRYCSESVAAQAGALINPGYPMYYPGDVNCSWVVRADLGQQLRVTVHDLNIRGRLSSGSCRDFLRISDQQGVLFIDCGDLSEPVQVMSRGNQVTVTLWTQGQMLYPLRGVLVQYKAVGCRTPAPPSDGYFVQRNSTHALFMCCVNFVFGDSLERQRWLHCTEQAHWHLELPDHCVDVRSLAGAVNESLVTSAADDVRHPDLQHQHRFNDSRLSQVPADLSVPDPGHDEVLLKTANSASSPVRPEMDESDSFYVDMVIPLAILVALIVINIIILLVIFRYRRRRTTVYQNGLFTEMSRGEEMCAV